MNRLAVAGPVVVAVAAVAAAGVVHGRWTDRWGPSGRVEAAVAALDRVRDQCQQVGDWVGEDRPLDEDALALGGIKGYLNRTYTNPRTRERVTVLIVCGRGGPISVHTPDICYAGAGYRPVGDPKPAAVEADGRTMTLRRARFVKPGGAAYGEMDILWGWSADGRGWDGPDDPRAAFARLKAVYKMYVIREVPPGGGEAADPLPGFLARAVPEFRAALAPAESPPPSPPR